MMRRATLILPILALSLSACARLENVGKTPEFTPSYNTREAQAMASPPVHEDLSLPGDRDAASLWSGSRSSLFGDRRAADRGDILTVVIEIDEEAEISNRSARARSGSEDLSIPNLLGLENLVNDRLPGDATLNPGVSTSSSSSSSGDGSVRRNEKLTLRIAATIVKELPNGVVQIEGSQEVRVNFEIRELLVSGYVRPEDISRRNEITYDKIASARISYGGRGQISDVQQPRVGQQVADIILPF